METEGITERREKAKSIRRQYKRGYISYEDARNALLDIDTVGMAERDIRIFLTTDNKYQTNCILADNNM